MKIRFDIIKCLINSKDPENFKNEKIIKENIENWLLFEKMIINKKCKKMKKETKKLLLNYFLDRKNKNNLLKIFSQEKFDYFIKEISYSLKNKKINEKNTISIESHSEKNESISSIQSYNK